MIPDTISRQQEQTLARRTITPSDLRKWPGLTFDGAGSLEVGRAFVGPTVSESLALKLKRLVFNSGSSSRYYRTFALSPDSTLFAAPSSSSTIVVWRLPDALLVQQLHEHGHTNEIYYITFSPDNLTLVSGSDDHTAIIWDIRSGRALQRLKGHGQRLRSAAYSPDSLLVATGSVDYSVKIWDASNGTCLHSLDIGSTVYNIMFSIDGSRFAVSAYETNSLYSLHSRTPRLLRSERKRGGDVRGTMAMSLQGDRIIVGNGSKTEIWSTISGEQLLDLAEHTSDVTCVAFSPDGAEAATGSADHSVVVCDSWTGQRRCVHEMPSDVMSVAYSPNGEFIAMGDSTGRVRICGAKSGTFIADLEGHSVAIDGLRFTAESRNLLLYFDYGPARMWNVRDVMRV